MAVITFTDDGVGIEPANVKRIFDPGFTTKGVGVGTGLGLSICYQIIQDHHGTIDADSAPGKGTTFTIRLPLNLDVILGVS
jgi:signal transduction histidine kinase